MDHACQCAAEALTELKGLPFFEDLEEMSARIPLGLVFLYYLAATLARIWNVVCLVRRVWIRQAWVDGSSHVEVNCSEGAPGAVLGAQRYKKQRVAE